MSAVGVRTESLEGKRMTNTQDTIIVEITQNTFLFKVYSRVHSVVLFLKSHWHIIIILIIVFYYNLLQCYFIYCAFLSFDLFKPFTLFYFIYFLTSLLEYNCFTIVC